MKVAIVLIPDSTSEATEVDRLAELAADAGWSLRVAESPTSAVAALQETARAHGELVSEAIGASGDPFDDEAELDRARRRSALLNEASALLSSSLDYSATLDAVARLTVPNLADWCAIDMLTPGGALERVVLAHADRMKEQILHDHRSRFPFAPDAAQGIAAVLRNGTSELYSEITDEHLVAHARSEEELEMLRRMSLTSLMIVPIRPSSRAPIGTITLVSAETGRRFTHDDLVMAEELARRAATAIENIRLYHEVRQGRELLQVTLSSIGEGVVATDTEGRITFMNGVAEAMTGWKLIEAAGRPLEEVVPLIDDTTGGPLPSPATRALEHGAVVSVGDSTVLLNRDGSRVPIDESAAPIRDADGAVRGIIMVIRDVADRKRAEIERSRFSDEIALQRARLRNLLMSVPGVVWEAWGEPDHELQRIDFVSDYVETMLGYTVEEWLSTPNFWLTIVHPDDRERAARRAGEIFGSGGSGVNRFRWVRRDGEAIWVDAHATVVCDDGGRPIGMRGVTLDVTPQVRAEEEQRAHGARLELLNEVSLVLSAELDMRVLVQAVTDAATRLCGARYGAFFFNSNSNTPGDYDLFALSGAPREAFAHFPTPRATDLFRPTFDGEAPLRIGDVTKDERYGRNSPYYGIPPGHVPVTSYMAVPVISRSGEVIGGLFFGHPSPDVFTELDERLVTALAAQAAITMDNARLYHSAQQEIEERKRAEEEMMRARDEAEAANRAKDQFLAVLSHELRTPLTPVLAVAHVLENDDRVTADQLPLIEMIRRNVELEARLIDDLLDLTRISKGKLSLTFETVDVHRLVHSVVSICRSDVANKQIQLSVDLQARDHFIRADSARMQQVLWNLVKNAIKFTPEGGSITVRTMNDRPGHLRIEVSDTGIGIDPALLPRIFNAFDQGSVDMRQYGGLGLGLSISRSLVEMHGGELTATSRGRGHGATFAVEIDTVVRVRLDNGLAVTDGGRRAVRVLIVDDHIETSKVMKLLLERRGYVVQTAHTLHDALEATRTADYDLLISDIGLPDGSGLDLMRAVAERPIRGIALSGFGMEEDIARSKEAGFLEHLIKPVSFQSLQETIGRVLG